MSCQHRNKVHHVLDEAFWKKNNSIRQPMLKECCGHANMECNSFRRPETERDAAFIIMASDEKENFHVWTDCFGRNPDTENSSASHDGRAKDCHEARGSWQDYLLQQCVNVLPSTSR